MDKSNLELKVGLLAVTGILILVLGTIWGKDIRLSSHYNSIQCIFDYSGGLRPGDPVTVNGVKKGRVEKVNLQGKKVVVTVLLERDVKLYTDASSRIGMSDLMGTRKLEIFPGNSDIPMKPAQLREPLKGQQVISIDQIMVDLVRLKTNVDTLLLSMRKTINAFANLLDEDKIQKPIQKSVADLAITSGSLRTFWQGQEPMLKESLENLNSVSRDMSALLKRNQSNLESAVSEIPAIITRIDSFSQSLAGISSQMRNRQGSLAKLVYDDEMYNSLHHLVVQMDSLTRDLKKNFGKYLQGTDINLIKFLNF